MHSVPAQGELQMFPSPLSCWLAILGGVILIVPVLCKPRIVGR